MRIINFLGSRVVKTGMAVFLTAFICELFNWPPVFAVITAIVTIEPTVSDSIRKGIIRLPASVIGSGYAVIFIALFGNSPITYTLAAVFTILTCSKLNLHVGLLVATLTSVAMVEVIHTNLLLAFLIRIGTTSIGLLVSTTVNMFVFPPDYTKNITGNIAGIRKETGIILEKTFLIILGTEKKGPLHQARLNQQYTKITQTETLVRFQNDEAKYHPLVDQEKKAFIRSQSELELLRMLHYHMSNLCRLPAEKLLWTQPERDFIMLAVREISKALQDTKKYNAQKHQDQLTKLTKIFWDDSELITDQKGAHPTAFPPELIILYELVAIYSLVDQLYEASDHVRETK